MSGQGARGAGGKLLVSMALWMGRRSGCRKGQEVRVWGAKPPGARAGRRSGCRKGQEVRGWQELRKCGSSTRRNGCGKGQEVRVETITLVGKALASNQWTVSEKELIKWQFGLLGGFRAALWMRWHWQMRSTCDKWPVRFPMKLLPCLVGATAISPNG